MCHLKYFLRIFGVPVKIFNIIRNIPWGDNWHHLVLLPVKIMFCDFVSKAAHFVPNAAWREPFLNVVRGKIVKDWLILKMGQSNFWVKHLQGYREQQFRYSQYLIPESDLDLIKGVVRLCCENQVVAKTEIEECLPSKIKIHLVVYKLSFSLMIVGGCGIPE